MSEDQDLKKKAEKAKDEAIKRAARLKKIALSEYSGWKDFVQLLDNYAETMMRNKAITNLSTASQATLDLLKLYDRDVWLIKNVIKLIPMSYVNNLEKSMEKKEDNA